MYHLEKNGRSYSKHINLVQSNIWNIQEYLEYCLNLLFVSPQEKGRI